jgi:hypothetical protein
LGTLGDFAVCSTLLASLDYCKLLEDESQFFD